MMGGYCESDKIASKKKKGKLVVSLREPLNMRESSAGST